jgi:hypothetical protein
VSETASQEKKYAQEYYQRIIPIVGDALRSKRIAFFNAQLCAIPIDAFARCGTKSIMLFSSGVVDEKDPISLFYGNETIGKPADSAVAQSIIEHNQFEKEWNIMLYQELRMQSDEEIEFILQERKADLIFGGGDQKTCSRLTAISKRTGIPAVIFCMFQDSLFNSGILVTHPELKNAGDFNMFNRFIQAAGKNPVLQNPEDSFHMGRRMDYLECVDLAMIVACSILCKGTQYEQKGMNDLIFSQRRNIILRGTQDWPWWVHYINISKKKAKEWLRKAFSSASARYYPPMESLKNLESERVIIIGCGTGSLIVGELMNYFKSIMLIDCKEFSAYNPVRQLISTRYIGEKKPFALQEILSKRVGKGGRSWKVSNPLFDTVLTERCYQICAAELMLKEDNPESVRKFELILDLFKPTLAIIAMGQTQDDNFVAARILRQRGIRHIIPSAFPSATHFKDIFVDGKNGPCYACLQARLTLDVNPGPTLTEEQRDMFYGGTQPATVFETLPSAHSVVRLAIELMLPEELRSAWLGDLLTKEKTCLVGGNKVEMTSSGEWLYGVEFPGQVVCYGTEDLVSARNAEETCECGRKSKPKHILKPAEFSGF